MRWPWVRRSDFDKAIKQYAEARVAWHDSEEQAEKNLQRALDAERREDVLEVALAEYRYAVEKITWPLSEPVVCPNCRSLRLHNMQSGPKKSMWQCHNCHRYTHFYKETGTVKVGKAAKQR